MLTYLAASTDTTAIIEVLEEEGALVVEGFLSDRVVDAFNLEVDDLVTQQAPDRVFLSPVYDAFFGNRTRHLTALATHSDVFRREILLHPLYRTLCDAILLPMCSSWQLNYSHIFEITPGAVAQSMHRDDGCWPALATAPYEIEVASILALSRFTHENGATLVVPGSHRWPVDRVPCEADIFPAVMPAGSALLYLGSTLHAAGANTAPAELRRGMHVSFCLGWLRTEENNFLATPLEQVRTFTPEVQAVLGYRAHDAAPQGGCLGVLCMNDPLELLRTGRL